MSILHLVSTRGSKCCIPAWRECTIPILVQIGSMRHPDTGEDAIMLSFGEQRFLAGYMNRLWYTRRDFFHESLRPMYPHDWHWATVVSEAQWLEEDISARRDGVRAGDVKAMHLRVYYEHETVQVQHARTGTQKASWTYSSIDITSKLILLQRCVRGYNARRRMARRLALAMALHSRLGNGSLLSHIPAELMLAAT